MSDAVSWGGGTAAPGVPGFASRWEWAGSSPSSGSLLLPQEGLLSIME